MRVLKLGNLSTVQCIYIILPLNGCQAFANILFLIHSLRVATTDVYSLAAAYG